MKRLGLIHLSQLLLNGSSASSQNLRQKVYIHLGLETGFLKLKSVLRFVAFTQCSQLTKHIMIQLIKPGHLHYEGQSRRIPTKHLSSKYYWQMCFSLLSKHINWKRVNNKSSDDGISKHPLSWAEIVIGHITNEKTLMSHYFQLLTISLLWMISWSLTIILST